jgi:hypothetical protein
MMYLNDIDENYGKFTKHIVNNALPDKLKEEKANSTKVTVPSTCLSDLSGESFVTKCCKLNFDPSFDLSTCTHTVVNCYFYTLVGGLSQFKHKWYQECKLADSKTSARLDNVYLGDEALSKLLEMTCKEAKALHKKSKEAIEATGNVQNQYFLYFENKRQACEFQLNKMSCDVKLKYDFERKKFCVVEISNVKLNR